MNRETAPEWFRKAVATTWGADEWTRFDEKLGPDLAERGITAKMLEPLWGGENEKVIIAIQLFRPGLLPWLHSDVEHGKYEKLAYAYALSDLVKKLDEEKELEEAGDDKPE